MEGDLGLGLVLLAVLFFGWGGLFTWRRFRRDQGAVDPKGAYPGDPKARVIGRVLDAVARSITSDLERTEMSYHPGDPREVLTLIVDIEQFRHLRKHRGMMQYEGIFVERDIERRWARRPPRVREWEGIELVAPIAIKAAFDADVWINTVRFWVGDMENYALTTCRVSVEARRLQSPTAYDWRFDKRAKGYLAPVTPHGNQSPSLTVVGLAEDPYDFEQQVAQMLRGRGLTVEVTGGTGDEGVDIIAYDNTPITGGTFLVQCKRYSPDKKVGVAEIRELYGTMQEKQSAKGVLVTSSVFTAGAMKFAEGKSIELIDGVRLSELIVGTVPPTRPAQPTPTAPPAEPVPDVFLEAFSEPTEQTELQEQLAELPQQLGELASASREVAAYLRDSALLGYAIEGDVEGIRRVLAQGANPDTQQDISGDGKEIGALHLAAYHGHDDAVSALLDAGSDVGIRDSIGYTPLHYATLNEHPGAVKLLVERGADIDALDAHGHPPIAGCVFRVWESGTISWNTGTILQVLLASGVDTEAACATAEVEGLTDLLNLMGCQP